MTRTNRSWVAPAILFLFAPIALSAGSEGSEGSEGKLSPLDEMYSYSAQYDMPIWVSARELARDPGRVALERLAPLDRELVEKRIESKRKYIQQKEAEGSKLALPSGFTPKIAESQCIGADLRLPPYSGQVTPTTFAGLVQEAEGILEAKITATQPGFFLGLPASLLEVQVTRVYRPLPHHAPTSTLYVFHSFARFTLDGIPFCNSYSARPAGSTQRLRAFDPEVGGRLLLFVFGRPLDREGVLITPLEDQILYESPTGELVLSDNLSRDDELHPARSLDAIEDLLKTALHQRPSPDRPELPVQKPVPPQGSR